MASKPIAKMIEFEPVFPIACLEAVCRHRLDRRLVDIDERDVVAVEGVVIAGIDAHPLGAERIILRRQLLRDIGIAHDRLDLAAEEGFGRVVRLLVDQKVGIGEAEAQAAMGPARLIFALPLLMGHVECRALVAGHHETHARFPCGFAERGIVGLDRALIGRVERRVMSRNAEIGRALEDVEMGRLGRDMRDRLDRRRAGADDGDLLAGEIDALMRPEARVVRAPFELVEPGEIGLLRRRQAARRHDAEARRDGLALLCPDDPAVARLVEHGLGHTGRQADVAAEIEPVGDMVDIFQDLGLGRIPLGPAPFLLQRVVEGVGVIHALDIAARTRVTVPVPGAADIVARLEHDGRKPALAQPVEHIEPGKAGSDDDGIDLAWKVRHRFPRFCCFFRSSLHRGC